MKFIQNLNFMKYLFLVFEPNQWPQKFRQFFILTFFISVPTWIVLSIILGSLLIASVSIGLFVLSVIEFWNGSPEK